MTRDFSDKHEGSQLLFIFTDRLTLFRKSHFSPPSSTTERTACTSSASSWGKIWMWIWTCVPTILPQYANMASFPEQTKRFTLPFLRLLSLAWGQIRFRIARLFHHISIHHGSTVWFSFLPNIFIYTLHYYTYIGSIQFFLSSQVSTLTKFQLV